MSYGVSVKASMPGNGNDSFLPMLSLLMCCSKFFASLDGRVEGRVCGVEYHCVML